MQTIQVFGSVFFFFFSWKVRPRFLWTLWIYCYKIDILKLKPTGLTVDTDLYIHNFLLYIQMYIYIFKCVYRFPIGMVYIKLCTDQGIFFQYTPMTWLHVCTWIYMTRMKWCRWKGGIKGQGKKKSKRYCARASEREREQ